MALRRKTPLLTKYPEEGVGSGELGEGGVRPRPERFELSQSIDTRGRQAASSRPRPVTLKTAGLVALTFFSVTGGPFGQELIIKASGPFYAIIGYIVFTLVWSVPEAVMTAELSKAFPEAAGFAAWTNAAFGPFAAWMDSWCSWVSGVVDNAIYPILFLDYLKQVTHTFDDDGSSGHIIARWIFTLSFVFVLTYLCYRGLDLTGNSALLLTFFVLAPFLCLFFIALPSIQPSGWLRTRDDHHGSIRLRPWINNLFWNVNYYDSASAWAGDVDPNKWGKAMTASVIISSISSLLPMLAATGADRDRSYSEYHDGSYVAVARTLAGDWLARWIVVAAAFANVGLFVSEMSSDAYQLMGMAEHGLLPASLASKSKNGTPTYAILLSAIGVLALHNLTFEAIIATENLLYCFATLMELAAFVKLVRRTPSLSRFSWKTIAFACTPGAVLLGLVAAVQRPLVWLITIGFTLLGALVYAVIGPTRRTCGIHYRVLSAEWAAKDGIAKKFGWDDRLLDRNHASFNSMHAANGNNDRSDNGIHASGYVSDGDDSASAHLTTGNTPLMSDLRPTAAFV